MDLPRIDIPETEIPKDFIERCSKGEYGGVMLVFLNGKNSLELNEKKAKIYKYIFKLKKQYGND